MIVENKHELGSTVRWKLAPEREMIITGLKVYMDGGYIYLCYWNSDDGPRPGEFYEGELE